MGWANVMVGRGLVARMCAGFCVDEVEVVLGAGLVGGGGDYAVGVFGGAAEDCAGESGLPDDAAGGGVEGTDGAVVVGVVDGCGVGCDVEFGVAEDGCCEAQSGAGGGWRSDAARPDGSGGEVCSAQRVVDAVFVACADHGRGLPWSRAMKRVGDAPKSESKTCWALGIAQWLWTARVVAESLTMLFV